MNSQTHTTKATEGRAAANTLSAIVKESNESVLSLPAVKPYDSSALALKDKVIQLGRFPTHTSYGFKKAGGGKKNNDDDKREREKDVPEIVDDLVAENDFENLKKAIDELNWLIKNRIAELAYLKKEGLSTPEEEEKHKARIALENEQLQRLQSAYRLLNGGSSNQETQVQSHPVIVAGSAPAASAGGGAQAGNSGTASRRQPSNRSAPAASAGGGAQAGNSGTASRQRPNNQAMPTAPKDSGQKAFLAFKEEQERKRRLEEERAKNENQSKTKKNQDDDDE